jgi:hypothetical protein
MLVEMDDAMVGSLVSGVVTVYRRIVTQIST